MQLLHKIKNKIAKYVVMINSLLICNPVWAAEELLQTQGALPNSTSEQLIKTVLGLVFVLILIFVVAWVARNYLGMNMTSNASLKTIAGISVGQKERVVLVQVGDRQVLLGVAPGNVNMLHILEEGSEVNVNEAIVKSAFAEKLKLSMKQNNS